MRIRNIIESVEQKQAYANFMLKYDVYSLRIACLIGAIHTCLFLVIDYSFKISDVRRFNRNSMVYLFYYIVIPVLLNTSLGYILMTSWSIGACGCNRFNKVFPLFLWCLNKNSLMI